MAGPLRRRGDPPARLVDVLDEQFGIRMVGLSRLPGEVDTNLRATDAGGRRYVVKISAVDADRNQITWQNQLLEVVARHGQVPAPHLYRTTLDGAGYALFDDRLVRLYSWLEGVMLSELADHPPALLHQWGQLAGHTTEALSTVAGPPDPDHSHHWELLRADAAIDAGMSAVTDTSHRSHVLRIMSWFDPWVTSSVVGALRHGVVHQDLNDFNVLAETVASGTARVCGVLDFSDALHTATVSEIAVAGAYAMLRKDNPLDALVRLCRGYQTGRELTEPELAVLFPLAAARLCVNAVTWSDRIAQSPGQYGRARMEYTWPAIEKLIDYSPDQVAELLAADRRRRSANG